MESNNVESSTPNNVESSTPNNVESSTPNNVESSISNNVESSISNNIEPEKISESLSSLSLPELLFLIYCEQKPNSLLLPSATVLALLLDLALKQNIKLLDKNTFFRGQRKVIVLANHDLVSDNQVLNLMISRLKAQKHDHSVQQWADHWCGNTWKELVFPAHPTEELRKCVVDQLNKRGLLENAKLTSKGMTVLTEVRDLFRSILLSSEEFVFETYKMTHPYIYMLIICYLCGNEVVTLNFTNEDDVSKATAKMKTLMSTLQNSNIFTEDVKATMRDVKSYLVANPK